MANEQSVDLPSSEAEWRERLSEEAYQMLREAGTEPAFSGEYLHVDEAGIFRCAGCELALFSTEAKYDSGSGWPSFWEALEADRIATRPDHSLGRERTEILCARCEGHLGHVFDDGPEPTGNRFCVNSASLAFEPDE